MRRVLTAAAETAAFVPLRGGTKALLAAVYIAAAFYFPWRLTTFNPDAPLLSWLVYGAEVFGLLTLTLHVFMTAKIVTRTTPAPLEGAKADIFVTTYNEPVSIVRRTLAAAKAVRGATRVVLLDDGARSEMAALAAEMGAAYLARGDNTHAKAGNLNHGLAHSEADFVATFDADHAPAPDFLERTLGYFRDARVAFVQTPQDFYNLDSIQHRPARRGSNRIWTEQALFFRVIQPGKDRWNAAFYCGSCAVMRRSALKEVGGFATGTIAEDLHTSIRLHKARWKSVYHNQSLAFGVSPATFEPYEVQRVRWGQGAMQVWRREGIVFARGLTIAQRLSYLASVITYFDGWQKAVFYALPPFVLITGVMPMANIGWEFVVRFAPWFILSLLLGEELGRGYARTMKIEQYNFLRFPAFMRATLALALPNGKRFRVTKKDAFGRDGSERYLSRLALVPAFALASIPFGIVRYVMEAHLPFGALASNIAWALFTSVIAIGAIGFAMSRSSQRRDEYRFRAPLPFEVHLPSGGWGVLRAIDIHSSGVRLAAPMGLDLAVGAKLEARLHLPGGPVPVRLRIRNRATVQESTLPHRLEIGCTLSWESKPHSDALAVCLYGSGVDHRLREITEKSPTLLGRHGEASDAPREAVMPRGWAPGVFGKGDAAIEIAAQPVSDTEWRVFSYKPITPADASTLLAAGARQVRMIETQTIPAGAGAMHLAHIAIDPPVAANNNAPPPKKKRAARNAAAAALGALALIAAAAPHARAENIGLAGAEVGDDASYVYSGVIVPIPGSRVGGGWAARLWGDKLSYTYEANGREIDADATGVEAAVVRQWSGAWGYSNASLGARFRDTSLSPDDFFNRVRGARWDLSLQLDGRASVIQHWALIWIASHQFEQRAAFARLGIEREFGRYRIGADVTRDFDSTYGVTRAGVTASYNTGHGWTIGARAGAMRNDDRDDTGAYVGLNLSLAFK